MPACAGGLSRGIRVDVCVMEGCLRHLDGFSES